MSENHVLIQARVLIPGLARGEALVLEDSLSFWGGFDPANGRIIDIHHPQYRQHVAGKILFIPQSRGSAGTPGGIAETIRNGSGPLAFVLGEADVNIGIGALVANRLYRLEVPILQIDAAQFKLVKSGDWIEVDRQGCLSAGR